MKGGARRKTISSDLPQPQPHPLQNDLNDEDDDQVQYGEQHRKQEQQQQGPMNDVGDGGNEYDEEEDEDYEDDDQSGDEDDQGEADEAENNGDEEGPKLAEGFYEIEAVRRKRIRKGETQYLIKWRGWPEAANTWEPVENLMSCPDVIDAFEESMRSGKQRSNRRRKRKYPVAPAMQSKKKQRQQSQQHSPAATYDVPSVKLKIIEQPLSVSSIDNSNFDNGTENTVGDVSNKREVAQSNNTTTLMLIPQLRENKEKMVLDIELREPKAPCSSNQENVTDFTINIQEERGANGASPGILKVNGADDIVSSSRVGARRRKSCAVKRFKQELNSHSTNAAADATAKTTNANNMVVQSETNNVSPAGNGFDSNNILDASRNVPVIVNIIKPVDYSTSILNDTENVSVSFLVMRSDGEEVIVDNKYLKENNPLLLINFYEQHLRYNSPSE